MRCPLGYFSWRASRMAIYRQARVALVSSKIRAIAMPSAERLYVMRTMELRAKPGPGGSKDLVG
jgi:hypothetical protein